MIVLLLILDCEEDRIVISELFESNYHRMKHTAMGILHESDAAEDAVQDTFVRCIHRIDTLRNLPEQARPVYLITAVKRNALNRLRKKGARSDVPIEDVEQMAADVSVEEQAVRSLTVAEVQAVLAQLPEGLKDVLRYKYLLELSNGEIAESLGVTKSTVRVYLMRARRAVQKLCKEKGYAEKSV